MALYRMKNAIQDYAWGSREMLPRITGRRPSDTTEAELWMGSHPKSPSIVVLGDRGEMPLDRFAGEDPKSVIGSRALELLPPGDTNPGLPYLFKILTAEKGLSIQAHPSREQARVGYARENGLGIPIDAPHRTYRDRNHKPELIYALEDFWGMRGFRRFTDLSEEIAGWCACLPLSLGGVQNAMAEFVASPDEVRWRTVMKALIVAGEGGDTRASLAESATVYTGGKAGNAPVDRDNRYWWVAELLRQFPGDPGAAAPLYLNLVHLHPGEAMYLDAQILHAYLYGAGVEIMANSDNVLRSGCTAKYVDGSELLGVLTFSGETPEILSGTPEADGTALRYPTPAGEFELLAIDKGCDLVLRDAPVIFLSIGGIAGLREKNGLSAAAAGEQRIASGEAVFSPASTSGPVEVTLQTGARLFVASIPGTVAVASA